MIRGTRNCNDRNIKIYNKKVENMPNYFLKTENKNMFRQTPAGNTVHLPHLFVQVFQWNDATWIWMKPILQPRHTCKRNIFRQMVKRTNERTNGTMSAGYVMFCPFGSVDSPAMFPPHLCINQRQQLVAALSKESFRNIEKTIWNHFPWD